MEGTADALYAYRATGGAAEREYGCADFSVIHPEREIARVDQQFWLRYTLMPDTADLTALAITLKLAGISTLILLLLGTPLGV